MNTEQQIQQAIQAERSRCLKLLATYKIPCGNSAAGEMACEWTYDALKSIYEDIEKGVQP